MGEKTSGESAQIPPFSEKPVAPVLALNSYSSTPIEKPVFEVKDAIEYVTKPLFIVEERSERVTKPAFSVVERPQMVEKPVFVVKEVEIMTEKRQILEKVSLRIHNSDWALRILLGVSAAVHIWSILK
jgi:hypothetical protein